MEQISQQKVIFVAPGHLVECYLAESRNPRAYENVDPIPYILGNQDRPS